MIDNTCMVFQQLFLPFKLLWVRFFIGSVLAGLVYAQPLPADVLAALNKAKVPRDAVSLLVTRADSSAKDAPRLAHRIDSPMNPASVMKLVTTYAALDLLGPAYTWSTPVYVDGSIRDGTLHGNVVIVGQGDPKLVVERLWLLLRRLQGLGIDHIHGDIILDNSAFELPITDAASFDGEPLRPYNASPDALLINYKSLVMTFTPNLSEQVARVQYDPPLAGVQTQATVPLIQGECGDYRSALKAELNDPSTIRFKGGYPASCMEKAWPLAYMDPSSFAQRTILGMWQTIGGKMTGQVRWGKLPAHLQAKGATFEATSATLGELVRDINKYSNNVMAQQVYLTLGRLLDKPTAPTGTFNAAHNVLQRWWLERISPEGMPLLENGSGLSRQERISAQALGNMLQVAYRSPQMPELMASLPITGIDGTMRRSKAQSKGIAHLKTGSLNNVVAVAGYVLAQSGQRYVLVALMNHPNANAARPAIEALVDWTAQDLEYYANH